MQKLGADDGPPEASIPPPNARGLSPKEDGWAAAPEAGTAGKKQGC